MSTLKEQVLADPTVHQFAKDVIRMAENHDIVDILNDLDLVKDVINREHYEMLCSINLYGEKPLDTR